MAKQKTPGKKPDPTDPDDTDPDDPQDDPQDDPEAENRRINAIVTSRVKREMKGVLSQLATLTDAIGKLSTPSKKDDEEEPDDEDPDADPAPKAKAVAKPDSKTAKQLTRLERELTEEREARKKAEQAQKDQETKAKRQEMLNAFDSALQEHGVTDPKLRRAALITLEQDGFMIRDEDDKIRFKGTDKYGTEVNYDPKAGLRSWVATEGKSFVPAVDAGGSGQGGARGTGTDQRVSKGELSKMSPASKAAIELERASYGLPPLE
jgi:hypothetical protein